MKKICLITFAPFLFMCCNQKKTSVNDATKLTISPKAIVENINSSQIFSSVKCIPLSTNDKSLVGDISKIVHWDGYFYLSDSYALFRFTEDGLFVDKISKRGGGPDEYAGISDFEINAEGNAWILSRSDKKINLYSRSGNVIKTVKLNCWAFKMQLLSPEKMCLYIGNELDENNQHQVKIIDLNTGNILCNFLEIDKNKAKYLHVHPPNCFCSNPNSKDVYFYNIFDEYIYSISGDTIEKRFQMDIVDKNIPSSFYNVEYKDISYFFKSLFSNDYAYGTSVFMEGSSNYLYSYYYEKEKHFAIISKQTNDATVDFTTLAEDVLLSGYPINLTETNELITGNNELIIPLLPSEIMEYCKSRPEIKDKMKEIVRYESEDQNVVLLTLKID